LLGRVYGQVFHYLEQLKEEPAGPPYVAYYNMDMQNLDIEIGIPVSRDLPSQGGIRSANIPGGDMASCLYTGPYNEMGSAYNALTEWVEKNGHQVTGVAYELYLNDPGQIPEQELQTQILFPLKTT
jgi:effector-binding domain-containing protein